MIWPIHRRLNPDNSFSILEEDIIPLTDEQTFCIPLRARVNQGISDSNFFIKLSQAQAATTSEAIDDPLDLEIEADGFFHQDNSVADNIPSAYKKKGKQIKKYYNKKNRSASTNMNVPIKEEISEQANNENQAHFEEFSVIENFLPNHIQPTQIPLFQSSFNDAFKKKETGVSDDMSLLKFSFFEEDEERNIQK